MSEIKPSIAGLAKGVFKDRGSKFLAFAEPIANEDEAKARIAWYKKKYHDARHVCYAYRLGENLWRTKDDGEPHGTAGMPILRSIDAQKLDNILVVVVRYFGGTKLGVPGLIAAYKESTAQVLAECEIVERTVDVVVNVSFSYIAMNDVMRIVKDMQPKVLGQEFDNLCTMTLSIREGDSRQLIGRLEKVEGATVEVLE